MPPQQAELIVDLLKTWKACKPRERKAKTQNYIYFYGKYELGAGDVILTRELDGRNKRVITTDRLFDELMRYELIY